MYQVAGRYSIRHRGWSLIRRERVFSRLLVIRLGTGGDRASCRGSKQVPINRRVAADSRGKMRAIVRAISRLLVFRAEKERGVGQAVAGLSARRGGKEEREKNDRTERGRKERDDVRGVICTLSYAAGGARQRGIGVLATRKLIAVLKSTSRVLSAAILLEQSCLAKC